MNENTINKIQTFFKHFEGVDSNGARIIYFDATAVNQDSYFMGNLGIRKTDPVYNFDVSGSSNSDSLYISGVRKDLNWNTAYTLTQSLSATSLSGVSTNTTLLGVGTVANPLYVNPNLNLTSLSATNISGTNIISSNFGLSVSGDVYIKTNNLNRLVAKGNGYIGIGTTTPAEQVDVVSTAGTNIRIGNTALGDYGRVLLHGNRTGADQTIGAILTYQNSSGSPVLGGEIRFAHRGTSTDSKTGLIIQLNDGTNVNYVGYIDETGKWGLGTSSPGQKLSVVGDGSFTTGLNGRLYLISNDGTNDTVHTGIRAQTDVTARYAEIVAKRGASSNVLGWELKTYNSAYIDAMTILGNGNAGFGTTAPAEKLEVAGNIKGNALQINADSGTADTDDALYFGGRTTDGSGRIRYDAATQTFYLEKRASGSWVAA
jgi:hypothetical protein